MRGHGSCRQTDQLPPPPHTALRERKRVARGRRGARKARLRKQKPAGSGALTIWPCSPSHPARSFAAASAAAASRAAAAAVTSLLPVAISSAAAPRSASACARAAASASAAAAASASAAAASAAAASSLA